MNPTHPLTRYRHTFEPPMSQLALAREVGVGAPTIQRWESGTRKVDVDLLGRVTSVTGISARELRPDLAQLFEVGR